jgi:hypothetical protein
MLSHGNLRRHVLGALVTDFSIELLYYDRSVIVRSTPLHFVKDPKKFVELLVAYAKLDNRQHGLETNITPNFISPGIRNSQESRQPVANYFNGEVLKFPNLSTLTLRDTIFRQHGLIGRGTCVIRAEPSELSSWEGHSTVIVKLGWLSISRNAENIYISKAIEAASNSRWVNHLPKVLYSHSYPPDMDGPHVRLIEYLNDPIYDKRELRLMVQTELFPITCLTEARDVKKVFLDILECELHLWNYCLSLKRLLGHNWLYTKAQILHRDISLGNLMYRVVNHEICGVLNDFDLASYVTSEPNAPSSKQRTGTRPFMAIDLLEKSPPPRHLYRHDLESLFYVFVFLICRYHNGTEINDPPLQSWLTNHGDSLANEKSRFLLHPGNMPKVTENFKSLAPICHEMQHVFLSGNTAASGYLLKLAKANQPGDLQTPSFDNETQGGHVNFATFKSLFQ